ncbi:hypothetical protein DFH08DRAFT_810334 [Mycena albidolilacea]|uniref:Uncharacterized protein n=1 Tax=Mycena albidolilacea TaxID=1033008 RepID=A0AAD6ZY25_9AGAR|nr:hypothetical protein DFH08DRAFT_810334 [Mycena albidolilacea]
MYAAFAMRFNQRDGLWKQQRTPKIGWVLSSDKVGRDIFEMVRFAERLGFLARHTTRYGGASAARAWAQYNVEVYVHAPFSSISAGSKRLHSRKGISGAKITSKRPRREGGKSHGARQPGGRVWKEGETRERAERGGRSVENDALWDNPPSISVVIKARRASPHLMRHGQRVRVRAPAFIGAFAARYRRDQGGRMRGAERKLAAPEKQREM